MTTRKPDGPKRGIPTAEEFARAAARSDARERNLEPVRESVINRFRERALLHEFFILAEDDAKFRCYVFFDTERDLQEQSKTDLPSEVRAWVFAELERLGRGATDEIQVMFELDSYENVRKKYGNYWNRLR
jgi:hypothetical protein